MIMSYDMCIYIYVQYIIYIYIDLKCRLSFERKKKLNATIAFRCLLEVFRTWAWSGVLSVRPW